MLSVCVCVCVCRCAHGGICGFACSAWKEEKKGETMELELEERWVCKGHACCNSSSRFPMACPTHPEACLQPFDPQRLAALLSFPHLPPSPPPLLLRHASGGTLYVGGVSAAHRLTTLEKHSIRSIVNCQGDEAEMKFKGNPGFK